MTDTYVKKQELWFKPKKTWRFSSFALLFVGLICFPLFFLLLSWGSIDVGLWSHLVETQLADLVFNSLRLAITVFLGVVLLGAGLAWVVTLYDFPGRSFFEWALVLPFAIPAYVFAFILVGSLDSSITGFSFGVRNFTGLSLSFIFAFYPYVYLLTKAALRAHGDRIYEVATCLGVVPRWMFFKLGIRVIWPAAVAGGSLAVMEVFADFGTVSVFVYDTFTTAIYKAWFGFFSLQTAAQLASFLVIAVLFWRLLESWMIKGRNPGGEAASSVGPIQPKRLSRMTGYFATCVLSIIFSITFLFPVVRLLQWVVQAYDRQNLEGLYPLISNSLSLGVIGASVVTLSAFFVSVVGRNDIRMRVVNAIRVATLGYALPGSILAVGFMLAFAKIDDFIYEMGFSWAFVGSVYVLIAAYVVRFLAVGYGGSVTAIGLLKQHVVDAAQVLGASVFRRSIRIYLPIVGPGLGAAFLMVLVDILKEMPATLLLRPFGWDTLAVSIYGYTAEGDWQLAALPACLLVLIGFIPVYIFVKRLNRY